MESPPSLLALPPETIANIGKHLDTEDLLAVRLTCRETFAAVQELFIKRYIEQRSHLFTRHGLEGLVKITANSRLAKHIKTITLVTVDLSDPEDDWRKKYDLREWKKYVNVGREVDSEIARRWRVEREALREGGKTLLASVFSNMTALGCTVAVSVVSRGRFDDEEEAYINEPYQPLDLHGIHALEKAIAIKSEYGREHGTIETAFKALMEAAMSSISPVHELSLCNQSDSMRDHGVHLNKLNFDGQRWLNKQGPPAWPNLKVLILDLDCDAGDWSWGGRCGGLKRLIRFTPALGKLVIRFTGSSGKCFNPLAEAMKLARIEELELNAGMASSEKYLAVLKAASKSLRKLKVVQANVTMGGTWTELLAWMSKTLELETVELDQLRTTIQHDFWNQYGRRVPGRHTVLDADGQTKFVFEGRRAGKEGLARLAGGAEPIDERLRRAEEELSRGWFKTRR